MLHHRDFLFPFHISLHIIENVTVGFVVLKECIYIIIFEYIVSIILLINRSRWEGVAAGTPGVGSNLATASSSHTFSIC